MGKSISLLPLICATLNSGEASRSTRACSITPSDTCLPPSRSGSTFVACRRFPRRSPVGWHRKHPLGFGPKVRQVTACSLVEESTRAQMRRAFCLAAHLAERDRLCIRSPHLKSEPVALGDRRPRVGYAVPVRLPQTRQTSHPVAAEDAPDPRRKKVQLGLQRHEVGRRTH